jgi:hypothetical protein
MTDPDLQRQAYHLELSTHQRLCFVLDASDLAASSRNKALQLLAEMQQLIPRFQDHRVRFLGSGIVASAGDLIKEGARMFQANDKRLSCITPVYESAEPDFRFVILAVSPIFDLQDWRDSLQLSRSVFVNLGTESLTGGLAVEMPPDSARLTDLAQSPLSRVTIRSAGHLPVSWDNPEYQLDIDLALHANTAKDFSLSFCVIGPEAELSADCLFENGHREIVCAKRSPSFKEDPGWTRIESEQDATIVRECVFRKEFQCPYCRRLHPRDELKCKVQGQFLPTSVFTTLSGNPACVFVLLQIDDSGRVDVCRIERSVLLLGVGRAAILVDRFPEIRVFDTLSQAWKVTEERFEQFQFVEGVSAYAICLR